ncbi:WYL domain-containing protein [Vibrio sp. RE86]|uniref:helix-turn-helix transcriptional regulator n=1 Tax=Vibrio sp. RE86 TaxID=2607605 RepID=UPI0014938EDB|nr:WYL domain-containing protein [Vibrio sp. RE86]NOH81484.1 WYL domain-containing protein [Vibrio sp. RE86]
MTKRASTRESLVLAFELLKRIPRSRKVTASELHEELEHAGIARDIRTIQRNLEMLCEHFEIERDDRTKPYGYSLKQNIDGLALPTLTPQESLLLALAEDYLSNLLPQSLMASMQSFFSEARHKLRSVTESSKERAWLKKVRFVADTQPLLPPEIESDIFYAVSEALFHDRFLTVEYTNANHRTNSALVMPLGLAQQSNRIYLVCRFDGFDNERSLALHRITKATVSTFNFERPKDFSLEQYDADGRFGFGEGVVGVLSFTTDKKISQYLSETPLSDDQTIEAKSEQSYQIKATVTDSLLLKRWLMAFGDKVNNIRFDDCEIDLTNSNIN